MNSLAECVHPERLSAVPRPKEAHTSCTRSQVLRHHATSSNRSPISPTDQRSYWSCTVPYRLQPVTTTIPPPEPSVPPLPVPDHEIIRRASRARNGQKFMRLWKGSTVDAENDHSAADLALCRLLGFWCGPRPDRIEALFRQSSLFRPKWDEAHYADGRTYGEATVEKAIRCQGDTQYKWGPLASSCHPT